MMRSRLIALCTASVLLASLLHCVPAHAYTDLRKNPLVKHYYSLFQNLPANRINSIGAVCEEIASLKLSELYPAPAYEIYRNNTYFYDSEFALGELDDVVYNRIAGEVELVAEVKCSADLASASKHGRKQLQRFETTIKEWRDGNGIVDRAPLRFEVRGVEAAKALQPEYFGSRVSYVMISHREMQAARYRFTPIIDLDHKDLLLLTTKLTLHTLMARPSLTRAQSAP